MARRISRSFVRKELRRWLRSLHEDIHVTSVVQEFIGESVALPVSVENGALQFDGSPIRLEAQGIESGKARLFVRPCDMTIGPEGDAPFKGVVKRIHGLGPARRVEIALGNAGCIVEIDAPRTQGFDLGQRIGLTPGRYRVFAK
jgi:sulfate transport system ATP-binding protein